ncbi:cyclic GMP-AMP synthase [Sorex araneus]|uniref:cyclic GMP-AMP synthase n=1 Tax=Sorex araneus TaxID=42254 RepID=UPI0024338B2C|nr:cyclic GMP-AMP synthase [Sorex araneus]
MVGHMSGKDVDVSRSRRDPSIAHRGQFNSNSVPRNARALAEASRATGTGRAVGCSASVPPPSASLPGPGPRGASPPPESATLSTFCCRHGAWLGVTARRGAERSFLRGREVAGKLFLSQIPATFLSFNSSGRCSFFFFPMPLPDIEPAFGEPSAPRRAPARGQGAPRTASKARAAAPKGSAKKRAPTASGKSPANPEAAEAGAAAGASRTLRRGRGSRPEKDGPPGSSRGARAPKAPACAGDAQTDGQAGPAEAQEPPEARPRARRSVREPRAPARPADGPGPDPRPRGWKARAVLDLLRLRSRQVWEAADAVNRVVQRVLRGLRGRESPFKGVELLNAGSYYERVKVSVPNEFDVMFKLEVPRIELVKYEKSAAFCFVKFKRNPKGNPLKDFLEDDYLSASMMLSKFREIIKEEILNIDDVTMEEEKIGSPAVTLLISKPQTISVDIILALELKSSWPESTQEGLPIHQWLGRKVRTDLRKKPYYLVAKPAKEGDHYQEKTWRLSFSHIEKKILSNHGESKTCCEKEREKCCRKDCLKLMKYLLEQLKRNYEGHEEMEKFCSYHMKTAFFHMCSEFPYDQQWKVSNLELCFENFVKYFLQCLKTNQLPHYFIPDFNLFSEELINKESSDFLQKMIEHEINNGFPIFKLKI